jgi:PAT family beta-lactamase induction signal transducer AmpG
MPRAPHPVVWTVLYLPFGALSGFVGVALTYLATQHGLSIAEGALLNGAQLLTQWLKWLWAPLVDISLSPRKWYWISTSLSGLGVLSMSAVPLGPATLGIVLAIIAFASLINSVVGMSVEAIVAGCLVNDSIDDSPGGSTDRRVGWVSAWFQAGNLGGAGVGGGLGLFLLQTLPKPWMTGAILAGLFVACGLALRFTPADVAAAPRRSGARAEVSRVVRSLGAMLRTKGGLLSAVLCVLPVGTGAAQVVLTQARVAAFWGAGVEQVALVQGLLSGVVTTLGCFAGGALCQRLHPRTAYAGVGLALAAVAVGMGVAPATVAMYVVWNFVYAFAVGLAYAAFTALVLDAMGEGSAATKYNVFASLSNFPLWWLGLLLGVAADRWGARRMLLTEAEIGVAGLVVFALAARLVGRPSSEASPASGGGRSGVSMD